MAIINGVKDVAQTATDVTAIKAVTDNLPDSGALTSISAETDKIASIKAVTDVLPNAGALTDISTETDKIASIKAVTDLIVPPITQATGTFSFDETSALEQDAITLTIAARAVIGSIHIDMVNVTQDTTIKLYHKIDGTNYRLVQTNSWLTTDSDGVRIAGFTAYRDVKVSLTCGGGGGGSVNVPYAVV